MAGYSSKYKIALKISILMAVLLLMPGTQSLAKSNTSVGINKLPTLRLITLNEKRLAITAVVLPEEVNESKSLSKKIEEILQNPRLNGAVTGVSIRNASDGDLIYSNFGDTKLRPASNLKMITAAVALETLGPRYQFKTEVLTDGKVKNRVLDGSVYLKGKGDPTLRKADFDQFARELKDKGIDQIDGDLIGDDSWYDDVRHSQGLNVSNENSYYGAQISALTLSPNDDFDAGTILIEVEAGVKNGARPNVILKPETDYLKIINKAKTGNTGETNTLTIDRVHGTNQIIIEGTIPLEGKSVGEILSVWEPTGYALDVFKKSLEEQGIKLRDAVDMKVDETPEGAQILTSKKSMTLEELLLPFLKLSNNIHGETLVKEMGKVIYGEGSWDVGLKVVGETIAKFGVDRNNVKIEDGSGLSHSNLIPPNELTKMLYEIQKKEWFPIFKKAQPAVGEYGRFGSGTLGYRMAESAANGKVHAKTGSLDGVSTLSGYVTTENGKKLIFSIMMNNFIRGSMSEIQDQIVTVLAEHRFDDSGI
ncbi:D-alanyl-D-alanine carboxypeptidase/D-alanyl-D-alanine-endopeptidase [Bacillus sp. FJAT-49711]|uniref:D-alanyl-D-alanine carboxypeptidase/D-alanyl-D-alanine endopeptidase n=1 Tax=Bacillus sp. FJAT-49711 TaxID=2833585 RepID=UPI001BC97CAB|nr:D-alanyl-D-alanine carboxypeptidase/D-alanyl-D-alanine-endopeptidase [Bacillus sp. FJAT-49711]MBS4218340.1 D-alanyl-D-alanine carboxypeptidase/D-alanyl-D-alanine-endopeptidase [Bacillus sp. FJAT-49711]